MRSKKNWFWLATAALLWASGARGDSDPRSAYTYLRESTGEVTVLSELNGTVEGRRNLPISAGDSVRTDDPGRAEFAMADGNVLQVGGGTELKFVSLSGQQGSDDEVTALDLSEGSLILSAVGGDERSVPRIDTAEATIYASLGSRMRVNADSRHGTAVIVRAGSVEVRTKAGSYTVRAGNYLTAKGDEEPEIARGDFSRDRFDAWTADRLQVNSESTRSASSRYVGEDYAGDVQSLDQYGDWDYNSTYSSYVWRPRVSVGWSPYSSGSWYYTPIGLSWWSSDPWGWYPNHYGNWFFDAGWNGWCWSPGYVYSPAWVYWGYSGSYLGWCPVGWYGGYSPWWNSYYRQWNYPRAGLAFAINGRFNTQRVDLRGWNFTGAQNVGGRGRVDVIPGTRVVDRLGSDISVSSRPIVLSGRTSGNVREALRDQIREAPRTIERASGRDSERLAPVLARDAKLPSTAVDALRDRAVVADRGRLSGPGASEIAPRGTTVVDRGRDAARTETVRRDSGRAVITNRGGNGVSTERPRPAPAPDRGGRPEVSRPQSRSEAPDSWRSRSEAPRTAEPDRGRATRAPEAREANPSNRDRADAWRNGSRPAAPPREESVERGGQSWRSRSDVPPARRVIDGAVPGRRAPETRGGQQWRDAPAPRQREAAPRGEAAPRNREAAPRDRDVAPRPRDYAPPQRDAAPRPRDYAPPQRDAAPRPRDYAPRERPSSREAAPAPRESFQRAPAPAPQAAPRYAPAPRSEPRSSSPRSAPAPYRGRPGRD
ncbi:MAG: DUF6600 domain-containing protein [Acidobacteriota bacterium]